MNQSLKNSHVDKDVRSKSEATNLRHYLKHKYAKDIPMIYLRYSRGDSTTNERCRGG